jgi:glc operon protein GlcG
MTMGMGRRLTLITDIADAVIAAAERLGQDVTVVAVDRGGREILSYRSDLTAHSAMEPARKKAVTAAAMGMPTSTIAGLTMMDPIGQRALAASPDMLAVPGGFPVIQDNIVIGGIGVAGGHYTDDQMLLSRVLVKFGHDFPAMPAPPPPMPGGPPPGSPPPVPAGFAQ